MSSIQLIHVGIWLMSIGGLVTIACGVGLIFNIGAAPLNHAIGVNHRVNTVFMIMMLLSILFNLAFVVAKVIIMG